MIKTGAASGSVLGYAAALMRTNEGLRSEAMNIALSEAIAGSPKRLYAQLGLASGLPGPRANLVVAQAFANECVGRGSAADKVALTMAALSADEAPGATELEFLPLCGVLALGARAAADPSIRKRVVPILHEAAEDMRFRVREAVPLALARIGEKVGSPLVHEFASWMDGYFQAAAVLLALADHNFLSAVDDSEAVMMRLDEAYALARDARRSTARYPGRKALVDALGIAPAPAAARFGVPMFDRLVAWANTEQPELRAAIEATLGSSKLTGRFIPEVKRVRAALKASIPPPRDPTILVKGMRGRGKKRSGR